MLLPEDRRRLLGAFVRTRREALPPSHAGGRRRTPGLRREEVATACGLSVTWYTWLEQGRDIAVSAEAFGRLAAALRLSVAERAYLFDLARRRDPARPSVAPPSDLQAVLDAIAPPAYLIDRLWGLCGANVAAARLFAPWFASGEPCLLRWVFLDPAARTFVADWTDRVERLVAEFRADTAALLDEPAFRDLVADLAATSPAFSRVWTAQAVLEREGGPRGFLHPQDGLLRYRQVTLHPAANPSLKLVMLLPLEDVAGVAQAPADEDGA